MKDMKSEKYNGYVIRFRKVNNEIQAWTYIKDESYSDVRIFTFGKTKAEAFEKMKLLIKSNVVRVNGKLVKLVPYKVTIVWEDEDTNIVTALLPEDLNSIGKFDEKYDDIVEYLLAEATHNLMAKRDKQNKGTGFGFSSAVKINK